MRHQHHWFHQPPARQRGVVLMITLIALVTLMLASISLFRSVDTAAVIAGNISFQKGTTSAADSAVGIATAYLAARENNDPAGVWTNLGHLLNVSDPVNGYYAGIDDNSDGTQNLPNVMAVLDAGGATVRTLPTDAQGNTSSYIIQRLCRNVVLPVAANCMLNTSDAANGEKKLGGTPSPTISNNLMYRVTIRTTGPRNSRSFIQAFIF